MAEYIERDKLAFELCKVICSGGYYPYCSNCNEEPKGGLSSFCPYCGAKMDLEE